MSSNHSITPPPSNEFNLLPINQRRIKRNNNESKNIFSPYLFFHRLIISHNSSTFSLWTMQNGEWGLWSVNVSVPSPPSSTCLCLLQLGSITEDTIFMNFFSFCVKVLNQVDEEKEVDVALLDFSKALKTVLPAFFHTTCPAVGWAGSWCAGWRTSWKAELKGL